MVYDVWFISYKEPKAKENWLRVKKLVPRAKRLANIKGLVRAYQTAAFLSCTDWFWIIDGDNWLLDKYIFDYTIPEDIPQNHLFVWPAINSINGLEYGNGGIKLYNRKAALEVSPWVEDFSIAVCEHRIKFKNASSETRINCSPIQAFTSGFREGFKLRRKLIEGDNSAPNQFKIWTTVGSDSKYGKYAISGTLLGSRRYKKNPDFSVNDRESIQKIFQLYQQGIYDYV